MKLLFKSSIVSAAILFCGVVHGATPGVYFGAGIGAAGLGDIEGFSQSGESQLGGRAFVGYNFNEYVGAEASYNVLGSSRYAYSNNPYFQMDYSLNAIGFTAKGYLPLAENSWNLYGLLGVAQPQGNWKLLENAQFTVLEHAPNALVATAGVGINIANSI